MTSYTELNHKFSISLCKVLKNKIVYLKYILTCCIIYVMLYNYNYFSITTILLY